VNFRYPIFLDVTGKRCLVTGEGYEVAGKVQALADAKANVTYVNPRAEPSIQELASVGAIQWQQREFETGDLSGCFLVITDREDNSEIFRLAEEQKILCNSVDDPEYCRFSFGSLHRQGDLTIAISTNGWAPAVAVRLREKLQREVGAEYGVFLALLKRMRPEITTRIADFGARRDLWYRIVDSGALAKISDGQQAAAEDIVRGLIEEAVNNTSPSRTSGDDAGQ